MILSRANDYYENDKERLKDKYRNLSEEEKNGRNRYRNMSEEKKQRLKEYQKAIARQKSLNVIMNNE